MILLIILCNFPCRPCVVVSWLESGGGIMKTKTEVGYISGVKYLLVFDKYKNQQACDYCTKNKWAWFLTVAGDYLGSFRTKKDAMAALLETL